MNVRTLKAGRTIRANPDRLRLPPQADKPKVRLEEPGTLSGNVGFYAQVVECSKADIGQPEPALAEVLIQEVDGEIYFTITPVTAPGDDVYEFKFESETRAPVIRGLKPLLQEAQIALIKATVYDMETEIVQNEEGRYSVVASWTAAKAVPRPDKTRDVAAGSQSPLE